MDRAADISIARAVFPTDVCEQHARKLLAYASEAFLQLRVGAIWRRFLADELVRQSPGGVGQYVEFLGRPDRQRFGWAPCTETVQPFDEQHQRPRQEMRGGQRDQGRDDDGGGCPDAQAVQG